MLTITPLFITALFPGNVCNEDPPMVLDGYTCGYHAPIVSPADYCEDNHGIDNGEMVCAQSVNNRDFFNAQCKDILGGYDTTIIESPHNYCDCDRSTQRPPLIRHEIKFLVLNRVFQSEFNGVGTELIDHLNFIVAEMNYGIRNSINSAGKFDLRFDIPCCIEFFLDQNNGYRIVGGRDLINNSIYDKLKNFEDLCTEDFIDSYPDLGFFMWETPISNMRDSHTILCATAALGYTFL